MREIFIRKNLLVLLSLLFIFPVLTGRDLPDNLLYISNYKFVNKAPDNYSKQIVLVSNRYFNDKQDSILEKGVQPDRKMFYFVIYLQGDSIFLNSAINLEEAIRTLSKKRDFLIFVNGYGKNFGQNLYRGFDLDKRYNLNVIIFDWPTDYQPIRKTAQSARLVTPNFEESINEFDLVHKKYYDSTSATLIFHSMGNHIAYNLINSRQNTTISWHIFENVILNAAGVTQFHHSKWVEKMNMQDRIYITSNKNDKTLKLLELVRLSTQLGIHAKAPHTGNATYLDFSLIAGEDHNYFIGRSEVEKDDPRVFNFYNTVFHGKQVNLNDTTVFKVKEKGLGYYIF